MTGIVIRSEIAADIPAVRKINDRAFGQAGEGRVVDTLGEACPELLSPVAVMEKKVVGHIFFSPVTIDGSSISGGMGLEPMAVAPGRQCSGIGSMLVRHGIELLRQQGWPFVIVLGHPEYYARFGFVPASTCAMKHQWKGVPEEAFMCLVFRQELLAGVRGIVRYHPAFDEAI